MKLLDIKKMLNLLLINKNYSFTEIIHSKFFFIIFFLLIILYAIILLKLFKKINKNYRYTVISFIIILVIPIFIFIINFFLFKEKKIESNLKILFSTSFILYLLIQLTFFMKKVYLKIQSPIFIFMISFIFLSLLGSILLMFPISTIEKISFIDALFTSASAVCVTGLNVLNTCKNFTFLGKIIILFLIELGGLGILTITSFFNYFFQNEFSFKEAIFVSSFLNIKTTKNVLAFAAKVVTFTIVVEIIGAILIYFSIIENDRSSIGIENVLFFSIFHSISAFCNSGFSILNLDLYSKHVRFNYFFQLIISFLIILGGIGFNILFNFFTYVRLKSKKLFYRIFKGKNIRNPVHIVTLNTIVVLITTFSLLFIGTLYYYISEYHYSLLEHSSFYGKWIASFFSSVSARTAGFYVLNVNNFNQSTILFTILLMWIGASPASTGGGIKTSTFALALMNIISLSKGKNRLEIKGREISIESIKLSFSIIILSLIIPYLGIFFITLFDPKKNFLSICFEVFSAFSTTGLSLGITPSLSFGSKLILIFLMFLGRVGIFNIMVLILRKRKTLHHCYKFPKENILIN